MDYNSKVYRQQGGDELVVDDGESINVKSGGKITADGTQAATIANAKADDTTGDLDIEAEIIAAVNAANAKTNAIIAALKGAGIIASS